MLKNFKNFLQVFLILLLNVSTIISVTTLERCSLGMRTTFVDNRNVNVMGTARKIPLSISFYEDLGGAVWLNREVRIEPRFEVHLKVMVNDLTTDQTAEYQKLDGFTIILSKYKDYLGGSRTNNGYEGLTSSYIAEIDGDETDSTFTFRQCFGTQVCSSTQTGITRSFTPKYKHTENFQFDIRFSYDHQAKQTKICFGETNCLTESIDLLKKFERPTINLGFTGFHKGNRRELNMLGTFICEDRYDFPKTNTYFTLNGQRLTDNQASVGENLRFVYSPKDIYSYQVPFFDDVQKMNYAISPSTCKISQSGISSFYERWFDFKCDDVGNGEICLYEKDPGVCEHSTKFKLISSKAANCIARGHDGNPFADGETIWHQDEGKFELKYGGKYFYLADSSAITFDIKFEDKFGNEVDFGTTEHAELVAASEANVNGNGCGFLMSKVGDYYRLTITKTTTGRCTITIPTMQYDYYFNMIAGPPSPTQSSCAIAGETTTKILQPGESFVYQCTLKDAYGNPVDASKLAEYYDTSYSLDILKKDPAGEPGTITCQSGDVQGSSFNYNCQAEAMGSYAVYVNIKGQQINAGVNTVNVQGNPTEFNEYTKYYYMSTKTWTTSSTTNYQADTTGQLLLIDFTDQSTSTLISKYQYSDQFNPETEIECSLTYPHDPTIPLTSPSAKFTTLNGKKYVVIQYTGSTDQFIKKTSFPYELKINFKGKTPKTFTFNYPLNLGIYQTCLHPLDVSKTTYTFPSSTTLTAGDVGISGTVVSRTGDGLLYNYATQLEITMTPQEDGNTVKISDGQYLGISTYELKFIKAGTFNLSFKLNGIQFATKTVVVNPSVAAEIRLPSDSPYTLENGVYQRDGRVNTDSNVRTEFLVYDQYGNEINFGKDVGITLSVYVDGIIKTLNIPIKSTNFENGKYFYEDALTSLGEYSLQFRINSNNEVYTFKYQKTAGAVVRVDVKNSKDYVMYGETHYFDVYFYDKLGQNIAYDSTLYQEAILKVTIEATTESQETITYNSPTLTGDKARFVSNQLQISENVTVSVKFDNAAVSTFTYQVGYEKIDTKKSTMVAKLSTEKAMSPDSALSLVLATDNPKYRFTFKNSKGEVITNIDPATTFEAIMVLGDRNVTLTGTRSKSYMEWEYPGNWKDEITAGDYHIYVLINHEESTDLIFPITIIDEATQDAEQAPYVVRKTHFFSTIIEATAGETKSFVMQLRTANDKRCYYDFNMSDIFSAYDDNGFIANGNMVVSFEQGSKRGEAICYVTQFKTTENVLHIRIKKYEQSEFEETATTVTVKIHCAKFNKLEIDPTCIKEGRELQEGTVISIPKVTFTPYDIYDNIYTDLFDITKTTKEFLNSLISARHSNPQANLELNAATENQKFTVTLSTKLIGTLTLTSSYYTDAYTINVHSGPIDYTTTEVSLTSASEIIAGTQEVTYKVTPRDIYGNIIDNLDASYENQFNIVAKNEITGTTFTTEDITFTYPYFEFKFNITEKGTIYFTPEFNSDTIDCSTCTIKVNPGAIFATNTIVYYENEPMDPQGKITIYNEGYPQFTVKFFDRFNNLIDDLSDDISLTGTIEGEGYNFVLDLRKAKDSYTLFVNSNTVRGQWEYLVTSENYFLKIVATGEPLDNYQLYIVNQESGDASNQDLDLDRTTFTPESVTMTAGEQYKINMEQKAIDGKRWNYWYENPETNITLSFTQGYTGCSSSIDFGDKRGRYIITVSCQISTPPNVAIQISVDGQEVQHTIPLVVNPGKIDHTIAKNKGKEESLILDPANADNSYSFIIVAYDKYENIANGSPKDISYSIAPPQDHSDAQIKPTITKNEEDNSFTIKLDPIYAGEYTISSTQFQNSKVYKFQSVPGAISARYSIFKTPTSAVAGQQDPIQICIFAFDKNNNFKEAEQGNNPFALSFIQPSETTENPVNTWNISTCDYYGEQRSAYVYYQDLRKAGDNTFKAVIGTEQLNSISCIVNVVPGEMHFPNSAFERFDPEMNEYVELKDGAVEDNKNTAPLYKLIPKDFYYNTIESINDKSGYTVMLTKEDDSSITYPFKLKDNNIPAKFIEFVKDDEHRTSDPYENLVNSSYILSFTKGSDTVSFRIQLKGDLSDEDASNEPADLNKTKITDSKLAFTAGGEGEFYIQITTENGYRKNSHEGYEFQVESCNTSDDSFSYSVEKSGTLGVYIIKVTTEQSNTLPEPRECPLTIYVKNATTDFAPVKDLHPLMTVSPKGIHHATIVDTYIESEGKLYDGNADTPYSFVVYTFDEYGNRNKGLQSTILISISPQIDQSNFVYNENNDGSITYTLTITKAGTYTISSDFNSENVKYLPSDYSLTIFHGQIAPLKSHVEIEKTKIEAGRTASILVSCKDQYDNEIKPNEVGDILNVAIYDPNNQQIQATRETLQNQIKYSVYLSTVGTCTWSVKNLQDEDILTKVLEVVVVPTDADTLKTVYKTGDDHKYDANTPYSISNTQESVSFKAEDYDIYGNKIVDAGKMTISNAILTGNSMEEIGLTASENQGLFTVEMPKSEVNETAYYTFTHLVSGSGYFFVFDVEKNQKDYTSAITEITNLNEFKNALAKDGRYTLMSNIQISASEFVVDKKYSVLIDLNGNTITVTANSNSGAKINGELILKNGNLELTGTGKAIVQLYDGSKYYAYNVAHTGGESSIAIEENAHSFIEIVGGSFTSTNLFSAEGKPENIIIMKGDVNAQSCTNAFISSDKNKAELRIYSGVYGFNTQEYLKSTRVSLPVTITSNKDYTGYGNGPFVAANTELSTTDVTFRAGDSYEVKMYFKTLENKLFNDEVNPGYVTFSVQDTSLSFTYQRGEVYGESNIILTSTKAVLSNQLTVIVSDKSGNSNQLVITVKVLPALIPSAERTRITLSPDSELTPPYTTVHFGLVLSDKYGNEFSNMCDELRQARFAIEEQDQVSAKIAPDNCIDSGELTFNNYVVSYPPNSHTINVIYYVESEGTKVLTEANTFKVTVINKVDFTKSDVKCPKCNSITAGEKLDLEVSLYDANKICYNENYTTIPLGVKIVSTGSSSTQTEYSFTTAFDDMDSCKNNYKMINDITINKAGEYILTIYGIEGSKQITIKEYNHIVVAGEPHKDHLYVTRELTEITNPIQLLVGNEYKFSVQARDLYDNPVTTQFSDKFGIRLVKNNGEVYDKNDLIKNSFDPKKDALYYQLAFKKTGNVKLYYTFDGVDVTYIRIDGELKQNSTGVYDSLLIKPGACSEVNRNVDFSEVEELTDIQEPVNFTITCFDEYNNRITEGGEEFNIEITVTKLESETSTDVKSKLVDNGDGTYNVTFNPPIEGTYTFVVKINGETIYENERIVIKVIPFCPPHGDTTGLNFECPGREKGEQECVLDSNITGCLTPEERCETNDTAHPFRCKVDGNYQCVASFSDCDCPPGYEHCIDWYQNQCYPSDSWWECPYNLGESCRGKTGYTTLCDDGVCRSRADLIPNKYVCPYGYYQCSDLTCVKSVEECFVYDEFQCSFDQIICDDQTCASSLADCPTRITCTDPNYYVCPDGTCVANEMLCKPIKCYEPTPVLCPSGACASRRDLCPKGISCGHTYSLCEDNICKHDCRAS